jgi:hypothetical protein
MVCAIADARTMFEGTGGRECQPLDSQPDSQASGKGRTGSTATDENSACLPRGRRGRPLGTPRAVFVICRFSVRLRADSPLSLAFLEHWYVAPMTAATMGSTQAPKRSAPDHCTLRLPNPCASSWRVERLTHWPASRCHQFTPSPGKWFSSRRSDTERVLGSETEGPDETRVANE